MFKNCILLICCLLLSVPPLFSQTIADTHCRQASMLVKMMDKFHYKPLEWNDSISSQVFTAFIRTLDPDGLYFTENDIDKLSVYRNRLDEEVKNQSCHFLNEAGNLYHQKLAWSDSLIDNILQKPFDFSANDSITLFTNEYHVVFAKDEKALKARWIKWLKYQMLVDLFTEANDTNYDKSTKEVFSAEKEARNKISIKEKRNIENILDYPMGFDNYVAFTYLNTIAERYDPHSSYFSPKEKKQFDEMLSSNGNYFGFSVEESKNGGVEITHLVPGGPAWKSNELNNGDLLLGVKFPHAKAVDLSYASLDEVNNILNSSDAEQIELTIGKLNGLVETVTLVKEKLQSDENVIKSYILNGEKKIGYISLPDFYTNPDSPKGLGCANDVAKELLKLEKEKIDGLILDLRNNGGGSMSEALELAGIFIDEGPLCLVKDKNKKIITLKDPNRGTIYNGPMAVLVNSMSASASELVSIALQDYHRAVIVGGTTYGKATYQAVLPIDTSIAPDSRDDSKANSTLGYVKVTMGKFYRVTGATHQQKGVVPDVLLPFWYDKFKIREVNEPYSLASDTVAKKVYYTPLPPLPLEKLEEKSQARVTNDKNFKKIKTLSDTLALLTEKRRTYSLKPETYRKERKKIHEMFKVVENLSVKDSSDFIAGNNQYDNELYKIDSYRNDINAPLLKNIQDDIYLHEAYKVMKDLIMFETK